ncbi:MAG: hypothetical protein COA50_11575 [Flavobacteriaceae bacterium]|nr:MAG: hypothetical protein COA50_11575 [Flavobacteriaceae bacterium]
MIWIKKIKAGALQFVLFIGAVIAVLLLSFVLVSYSNTLFHKKTDVTINLIQMADLGLKYSFSKNLENKAQIEVPAIGTVDMNVSVENSFWGLYEKRTSVAKHGKIQFTKIGLVGQLNVNRPALYLRDNQRPMIIAGNAKISGTAYLPERGIRMGNIYGNSYYRDNLIYGQQKKSNSTFPKLDTELQQQIKKLTQPFYEPQGDEVPYKEGMVLKNSFKEKVIIIKGNVLDFDKIILSGNIIIWATHKISVGVNSQLKDVILIAPEITIENWVKGNFQAFASNQIWVGKGCELSYPSALVVHKESKKKEDGNVNALPDIFIDSYSVIRGVVLHQDKGDANKYMPQVKVDDHAKIIGELYCSNNLELKGSISGSVTTGNFIALENASIYQNHLYNGTINNMSLPMEYVGLQYNRSANNGIIKWLY